MIRKLLVAAALLLLAPSAARATDYFFSTSGSDAANSCTTQGTPCQTIGKANSPASPYAAGSRVLLHVCDAFSSSIGLAFLGASSGFGTQNVANGGDVTVDVYANGGESCGDVTRSGLTVTGSEIHGVLAVNAKTKVYNIRLSSSNSTTLSAFWGGSITNSAGTWNGAAIHLIGLAGSMNGSVASRNVLSEFANGVLAETYGSGTMNGLTVTNNLITQASATVTADNGVVARGPNIDGPVITGNLIENIGGHAKATSGFYGGGSGNGILVSSPNAVVKGNVGRNLARNIADTCGGPVGMWAFATDNGYFADNEVHDMYPTTPGTTPRDCDMHAFGADNQTTNMLFERNYAHDNYGAAFYSLGGDNGSGTPSANHVFRDNVAYNNGTGGGASCYSLDQKSGTNLAASFQFYNNTCVGSADWSIVVSGTPSGTGNFTNVKIANNLHYVTGNGGFFTTGAASAATPTLTNNLYYHVGFSGSPILFTWNTVTRTTLALYQGTSGQDGNALASDPKLTSVSSQNCDVAPPPSINVCPTGYALNTGSPAIGAGYDLSTSPFSITPPLTDRYGHAVPGPAGYNIGAWSGGSVKWPVAVHDFDGDGKSDILWRDSSGNDAVWLQSGATTTSSGSIASWATTNTIRGQGDFDGDGMADILWRDTSGNLAIWYMSGVTVSVTGLAGSFGTYANYGIESTADFDGDGVRDMLLRNPSTGNTRVYITGGSYGDFGNVASNWQIVGTADLDGDGKADILWRDASTGDLAVWFISGTSVASSATIASGVAAAWSVIGTGDFDGNGKFDILWRNTSTGDVAIWLMSGSTISNTGGLGTVATNWVVSVVGDYDGDGRSDLLWRNGSNGDIAMWFMNGLSVAGTASLGNVSLTWTIQGAGAD